MSSPVRYGMVQLLAAAVADAGIGAVAVFLGMWIGDYCHGHIACDQFNSID